MKWFIPSLLAATLSVSFVSPAAAIPVFDSANYAQNVMTAARTLQQINQQIQSLQNEAEMLLQQKKHLMRFDFPELEALKASLAEVDKLMAQAKGISFDVQQLDQHWRDYFPSLGNQSGSSAARAAEAKRHLELEMAAFQQVMSIQSRIAQNIADDGKSLASLSEKSNLAQGSLQAVQATNQLLTLAAKQQSQLQSLMAAQYRAETIEKARRGHIERAARAAADRFLGDGKAWSPNR